jgi:ACS family allantoate permease-like MFS transporter
MMLISIAHARTGPQTFRPEDAPRYVPAEATIIACYGTCLFILAFIHFYCVWQNKKKAQIRAVPGYVKLENQEYVVSTEFQYFMRHANAWFQMA